MTMSHLVAAHGARHTGPWRRFAVIGLLLLGTGPGFAADRERMPIVLRGVDFGSWVGNPGVPISHIYLYRFNGSSANPMWTPLRFQIDKRRQTNLLHNIFSFEEFQEDSCTTNPRVPCPFTDLCALTYFPPNASRCSSWDGKPGVPTRRQCAIYMADWNKDYLLSTDEIVVMARDLAGSQRDDCPYEWLDPLGNPGLQGTRQEIEIHDNGDVFWIYAYRWSQPPPNVPEFVAPGRS